MSFDAAATKVRTVDADRAATVRAANPHEYRKVRTVARSARSISTFLEKKRIVSKQGNEEERNRKSAHSTMRTVRPCGKSSIHAGCEPARSGKMGADWVRTFT